eukprot:2122440-Amphidinium_carterae.1
MAAFGPLVLGEPRQEPLASRVAQTERSAPVSFKKAVSEPLIRRDTGRDRYIVTCQKRWHV